MGQDRTLGLKEKHSTDRPGDRAHGTDGPEGAGRAGAEVSAGEGEGLPGDGPSGRDRGGLAPGRSGPVGQAAAHGAPGVATSGGRAWVHRTRADGAAMGAGTESLVGTEAAAGRVKSEACRGAADAADHRRSRQSYPTRRRPHWASNADSQSVTFGYCAVSRTNSCPLETLCKVQ